MASETRTIKALISIHCLLNNVYNNVHNTDLGNMSNEDWNRISQTMDHVNSCRQYLQQQIDQHINETGLGASRRANNGLALMQAYENSAWSIFGTFGMHEPTRGRDSDRNALLQWVERLTENNQPIGSIVQDYTNPETESENQENENE